MSEDFVYPVRAGVFDSVNDALELVDKLRAAGFSWDHVSVICSDELKEELFPEKSQHSVSGANDNQVLDAVGAGALGLAGLAAVAAILSTAGTAVMIMGAFAGVAAAGTFTSLMATRGFESEASDYYEQAVEQGKVLVAVEVPGDDAKAEERRALAARLIEESGAKAIPLAH